MHARLWIDDENRCAVADVVIAVLVLRIANIHRTDLPGQAGKLGVVAAISS